jgi:periplasmic protein TonB
MEDSQVTSLIVESPRAVVPTTPVGAFTTVPFAFARRQRGRAWLFSLVVHGGVLALALWGLGREVITPAPTVQIVFVAPPPPPPPPLGVPEGKGSAPIAETPPQKVKKPPSPVKPEPKPPKRIVTSKQVVKLKELKPLPPVAAEPPVTTPTFASGEEPQAGVATGSVDGGEGGIPGGVKDGTFGGVKDGVIAAPLRVDQVAHPPVLISRVDPDYPEIARLREIEGRVVLEAIVDRAGQIESEIKVLKSVAVLDKAAIEALKHWHFMPGRDENGQAVRVILEVPIRFVLE